MRSGFRGVLKVFMHLDDNAISPMQEMRGVYQTNHIGRELAPFATPAYSGRRSIDHNVENLVIDRVIIFIRELTDGSKRFPTVPNAGRKNAFSGASTMQHYVFREITQQAGNLTGHAGLQHLADLAANFGVAALEHVCFAR